MKTLHDSPTTLDTGAPKASASGPERPHRDTGAANRWGLVVVAGLAIFMAQLDTTIVNVALPAIEADLAVTTSVVQWVVLAYLVPLLGFSLLTGRWLDTIGHRPALTVAVTGFALASVVAGASPNVAWLLAARAAQGAFGALLLALAPVLAVSAVSAAARGRALGIVGTLAPLGAMSGPVVGGHLVDSVGWPWIFYTNVPVALLILTIGRSRLPRGTRLQLPKRSWLAEAAILGTAAVAVLLTATFVVSDGWRWAALALVVPPLLAIWRRTDTSRPVRALLATPGMAAVQLSFVSAYTVLLLVQFLAPFYLVRAVGASATVTGLTLLALPAATAVLGVLSGVAADRIGNRRVAVLGAAVVVAGVALILPLSSGWSPVSFAWRLAVLGVGFGLFMTPATSLAMGLAPRNLLGVTSASTNLARFVGLALGPAVATAAWAASGYRVGGMRAAIAVALVAGVATLAALLRTPGDHEVPTDGPTTGDGTGTPPAPGHSPVGEGSPSRTSGPPDTPVLRLEPTPLAELERELRTKRQRLEELRETFILVAPAGTPYPAETTRSAGDHPLERDPQRTISHHGLAA